MSDGKRVSAGPYWMLLPAADPSVAYYSGRGVTSSPSSPSCSRSILLMSLTTSLTVADLVFALLDHLDSGTHFELGYARKEETPVIGYADNLETSSETMILGSGSEVYDDLSRAGPLSPVFSESRG